MTKTQTRRPLARKSFKIALLVAVVSLSAGIAFHWPAAAPKTAPVELALDGASATIEGLPAPKNAEALPYPQNSGAGTHWRRKDLLGLPDFTFSIVSARKSGAGAPEAVIEAAEEGVRTLVKPRCASGYREARVASNEARAAGFSKAADFICPAVGAEGHSVVVSVFGAPIDSDKVALLVVAAREDGLDVDRLGDAIEELVGRSKLTVKASQAKAAP